MPPPPPPLPLPLPVISSVQSMPFPQGTPSASTFTHESLRAQLQESITKHRSG